MITSGKVTLVTIVTDTEVLAEIKKKKNWTTVYRCYYINKKQYILAIKVSFLIFILPLIFQMIEICTWDHTYPTSNTIPHAIVLQLLPR